VSNWVGVLIALSILTLAAALGLPALLEGGSPVGRYQLVRGSSGTVYRIDTTNGDTWVSVGGTDWHLIGEEDEGESDQPAQVSVSAAHRLAPDRPQRHLLITQATVFDPKARSRCHRQVRYARPGAAS